MGSDGGSNESSSPGDLGPGAIVGIVIGFMHDHPEIKINTIGLGIIILIHKLIY